MFKLLNMFSLNNYMQLKIINIWIQMFLYKKG